MNSYSYFKILIRILAPEVLWIWYSKHKQMNFWFYKISNGWNISNNLFKSRAKLDKKQRLSKGQRWREASSLESQGHTRPAPQHLLMPAHWNLRVYWQQRGQDLGHISDWISYAAPLPHTHTQVEVFEGLYSQRKVKLEKENLPTIKGRQDSFRSKIWS